MGGQFNAPIVGGLTASAWIVAEGIRFVGQVTVASGPPFGSRYSRFEGCRFDATLATGNNHSAFLYVRGCMFLADVHVVPYSCEFVDDTFISASLDVGYEGFARYIGNAFVGPGAFGLRTSASNGGVTVSGNTVSGKVDGIVVWYATSAEVMGNSVAGCSGDAFKGVAPSEFPVGTIDFRDNQVRNCGGDGFNLERVGGEFVGNVVDSVGGDGLRWSGIPMYRIGGNDLRYIGGRGITSDRGVLTLSRNTIIDTSSDGIVVEYASRADSNVIGRTGGAGLRISEAYNDRVRWNTVFLCAGDGIDLHGAGTDSISNNIAFANGGAGLVFSGTGVPVLSCNDWHANTGGATVDIAPGASDLGVDPLFCNVSQDDVHLSAASPLLEALGCGQIGALGEGCTAGVSVGPETGDEARGLRVFPHPTRDHVTFAWAIGTGPVDLEVFDVNGARRWKASAPQGTRSLTWDLGDASGERLTPGVYWARVAVNGQVRVGRLVLVR
jgi:hypothetical protein